MEVIFEKKLLIQVFGVNTLHNVIKISLQTEMRHNSCKHISYLQYRWNKDTKQAKKINFWTRKENQVNHSMLFSSLKKKNDLGKFKIKLQIDRLEEGLTDYPGHCILTKHRRLLILFA